MQSDSTQWGESEPGLEVVLDGKRLHLPTDRRSLVAIRSYLETIALEQQRFLCAFRVDGRPIRPGENLSRRDGFSRIEGKTIDLAHLPLQMIRTARHQVARIRAQVNAAIPLVLVNAPGPGREHWWKLARDLKQPLLTLSLMTPSTSTTPNGTASLVQLRRWQLQQLAALIREVDESCWSENPIDLSNALEKRVVPWLDALRATLDLWQETLTTWCPKAPEVNTAAGI